MPDEGQEWSSSNAHGEVVVASLRAALVALWQGSCVSD